MTVVPHTIESAVADMSKALSFYRTFGLNVPGVDLFAATAPGGVE